MRKKVPDLKYIIEGCTQKDFRCEELLYKTFYGYVSGVTFRYIKERTIIKEVVNDSFFKIFKKIESFSFNGPAEEYHKAFSGWIGQIAANSAIDRLRATKKILYIDDIPDESKIGIAIEAEDNLSYDDVMKLLDGLPPIQQLIFNMYAIEGFSHEEIASKLNILPNTSRVYFKRARTKLILLYQADLQ